MKREIIDYFKNKKEEIIKTISELVAVPSVCGVAEEGKPFSEKPYEALMLALEKAESFGLKRKTVTVMSVRLILTAVSRSWRFWHTLTLFRPVRVGRLIHIRSLKRTA